MPFEMVTPRRDNLYVLLLRRVAFYFKNFTCYINSLATSSHHPSSARLLVEDDPVYAVEGGAFF